MSDSWIDYPIGAFRAAASSTIGGLFLCVLACVTGEWLHMVMDSNLDCLEYGFYSFCFPEFSEMVWVFFVLPMIGVLSGYGIPLVLLQLGCVILILREENMLHCWFGLAYCQALLTYICLSVMGYHGFGGWHLASITVTLLVLGVTHGLLVWFMAWRIKRWASYNDVPEMGGTP